MPSVESVASVLVLSKYNALVRNSIDKDSEVNYLRLPRLWHATNPQPDIEMFECLIRHQESRAYTPISLASLVGDRAIEKGLLSQEDVNMTTQLVSKPLKDTRGHTSYLTFAKYFSSPWSYLQISCSEMRN
jgi:hypothetical protein